ncbi:disabled homolog 2-interacting protein isoform X3 [Physeter macrocephalus]|uniref:Disabled homolog 2-interacting protein isoform X3 n=1 Tax=Physeter macrocephalus TaxID=9755 RepID=A0A9W2WUY7_PHYMC|nr:disabled homolog 2-interacting protein isoform X3 [Physeter catodon]XP_054942960.1 disabled homolog 2-interacting protein isoform X3 [Physeter catodon]
MPSRTPLQKLRKIGDQDLCSKKSDLRVSVDHKLTRTGYEKGRATPPLRGQLGEAHRLTGCGQRPPHERPDTAEREVDPARIAALFWALAPVGRSRTSLTCHVGPG